MPDKIDEHLGLGPKDALPQVQVLPPTKGNDLIEVDAEDDFEFARRNIRELVGKGKESLESIMDVAEASEAPRAFEVVATLIDKLVGANKTLVDMHDKKHSKDAKPLGTDKVVNNTQNVVMVGSTNDLLRMMNSKAGEADGEDELER